MQATRRFRREPWAACVVVLSVAMGGTMLAAARSSGGGSPALTARAGRHVRSQAETRRAVATSSVPATTPDVASNGTTFMTVWLRSGQVIARPLTATGTPTGT